MRPILVLFFVSTWLPGGLSTAGSPLEDAKAAIRAKDYPRAIALLRPSAEAGDPEAQFQLALSLSHGERVLEADQPQARLWYLKAARQGHLKA
ncbi:MAG: hypothetical protein AAB339_10515, partial [Elusimicrobiota bacterium]